MTSAENAQKSKELPPTDEKIKSKKRQSDSHEAPRTKKRKTGVDMANSIKTKTKAENRLRSLNDMIRDHTSKIQKEQRSIRKWWAERKELAKLWDVKPKSPWKNNDFDDLGLEHLEQES